MFCKWCGMESVTTDQCSWCHRALTTTTIETKSGEDTAPPPVEEPEAQTPSSAAVHTSAATAEAPVAEAVVETAAEEPEPKAPWTISPPVAETTAGESAPPPAAVPAAEEDHPSAHPIIGVKRPGSARGGGHIPAPGMPPASARQNLSGKPVDKEGARG